MGEWQHGLCGCFDNLGACILGYFVPCYTIGKDAETVGDSCILCGILALTPAAIITIPIIRQKVRERQGIDGGFISDCLLSFFCMCCVVVQMHQECMHMSPGAMAMERE